MRRITRAEVIIVGGGLAGLSAAVYLRRALRDVLVIDEGKSMARWEPDVQNYLGFPQGVDGADLLKRGRSQAARFGTRFARDTVRWAKKCRKHFSIRGEGARYQADRLLLTTGIFHLPPDIPGLKPCLGHSMFFCKDCDGYRVQGKPLAIYGWRDEAVEYALGMLLYSHCVSIVTDGRPCRWSRKHANWLREYHIPVYRQPILDVGRKGAQLRSLKFEDGCEVEMEAIFTTRGDVFHTKLARQLGAALDDLGQILVDTDMRTSTPGLYAAGCVTPANCQMIIAAGQGATAAQALNRDLFEESLKNHQLRAFRHRQVWTRRVVPRLRKKSR